MRIRLGLVGPAVRSVGPLKPVLVATLLRVGHVVLRHSRLLYGNHVAALLIKSEPYLYVLLRLVVAKTLSCQFARTEVNL